MNFSRFVVPATPRCVTLQRHGDRATFDLRPRAGAFELSPCEGYWRIVHVVPKVLYQCEVALRSRYPGAAVRDIQRGELSYALQHWTSPDHRVSVGEVRDTDPVTAWIESQGEGPIVVRAMLAGWGEAWPEPWPDAAALAPRSALPLVLEQGLELELLELLELAQGL